jgi:hypothetical protein
MPNKAELKADYRQNWHRLRKMGVYQIKNEANGKVHLDASLNLEGAIERDRTWLKLGGHMNKQLQEDWNLHGMEAFTIDILEVLDPSDEPRDYRAEVALLLEVWMETLRPYGDKGYLPVPRR